VECDLGDGGGHPPFGRLRDPLMDPAEPVGEDLPRVGWQPEVGRRTEVAPRLDTLDSHLLSA
jgi:hypothetical protein